MWRKGRIKIIWIFAHALPSSQPLSLFLYCTCPSLILPRFGTAIDHHIRAHRTGSTTNRELCSTPLTTPLPLSRFGRPPTRMKEEVKSPELDVRETSRPSTQKRWIWFFEIPSYRTVGPQKSRLLTIQMSVSTIQMSVHTIQMSVHRTMGVLAARPCSSIHLQKIS